MLTVSELLRSSNNTIKPVNTSNNTEFDRVYLPSKAQKNCLCFISTEEHFNQCKDLASVIIVNSKILPKLDLAQTAASCFETSNIPQSMSLILPLFDRKNKRFPEGIDPTAIIDPSAKIGKNVSIAPYVVIQQNVIIGDFVRIGAHTIIECDSHIGNSTTLHPNTFIGADTEIGERCEIHSFVSLGSDGFGFHNAKDGTHHKIPQVGRVVIEDDVEIGAMTTVDRATIDETRIGKGSKLDKHCHISHNCKIGTNNVFAGCFRMGGSATIGSNCMSAGEASIVSHIHVGDNVILAGRAAANYDVKEPGAYIGFPLQKMKDGLKTMSSFEHLPEMRRSIAKILNHLGLE